MKIGKMTDGEALKICEATLKEQMENKDHFIAKSKDLKTLLRKAVEALTCQCGSVVTCDACKFKQKHKEELEGLE